MKSSTCHALLLSLVLAAVPVQGGRVNPQAYRLREAPNYISAARASENDNPTMLKRSDYLDTAIELVKRIAPDSTFRIVDDHYVGTNGVGHVYFRQTVDDRDVENADFSVNIARDGSVFSYSNSFFSGNITSEPQAEKRSLLDPVKALRVACTALGLPISGGAVTEAGKKSLTIKGTEGTEQDPEARLAYIVKSDGNLALTWRVETKVNGEWLVSYVEADVEDRPEIFGVVDYISHATVSYEVYPWGLNDPSEGSRKIVTDPWDTSASPSGWHDSQNITDGNNANAGSVPVAEVHFAYSETLAFEFPYTPDTETPDTYKDAAITQIFYTVNMYHDLLYILGFTPAAGNFQVSNNGEGGVEGDPVRVLIQHYDGMNNGKFSQTVDGTTPELTMYVFNYTDPERDGAFDNGFVIHEYTHGLSGRLTGGPANSNCLNAWEADGMAEGWGDLYASAVTLKANDTRSTASYGFAAWPTNSTNPATARLVLYSTDMDINPWTYSTVNGLVRVHEVGTAWATMLYEVLWNLIDKHGKNDAERPKMVDGVPTDGKYLMMKLLMDAMALQPCNPTFIQARDAIIDADIALTDGENACEIWTGFAKRGLGENAVFDESNRVDDFAIPEGIC